MASEQKSTLAISRRPRNGQTVLTGQVGVIDLNVSDAGVVQDLELGLVSFGDIGKVFVVVVVDSRRVGFVRTVSEMVPIQTDQNEEREQRENRLTRKD